LHSIEIRASEPARMPFVLHVPLPFIIKRV